MNNSQNSAMEYHFPFGMPLKRVEQVDKSPKKVFVLGVYASAVHAKWIGEDGKQKISALAVASEPEIFWRGENAKEIINTISVPKGAGKLVLPTNKNLNGPSGRTLDDYYLKPLELTRKDVWLCDLLPESRVNEKQKLAIEREYLNLIPKYNLPFPTGPVFKKTELNSQQRRLEILSELKESRASTLVLLGDEPIRWFLHYFDPQFSKLSDFGNNENDYGKEHTIAIDGELYKVIPLCHPRQAGRLGTSSIKWGKFHDTWINSKSGQLPNTV